LYPSLTGTNSNQTALPSAWYWNICFAVGSIPAALASVVEEKFFSESKIHISYMLCWSNFYQVVTIFLSFPVDCIPGFGSTTFSNFFQQQKYAFQCFAGQDIPADICKDCECGDAWKWVILFQISYIGTNAGLLGVVKYGSATFSYLVSTLVLPLSEFCFAIKFIMGQNVETLSSFNYGALAILLLGVSVYRFFEKPKKPPPDADFIGEDEEDEEDEELKEPILSDVRKYGINSS